MSQSSRAIILVHSTGHAIRAEQILYKAGIHAKLIPVPRHLSSNCGTCLQIACADIEKARKALEEAHLEIEGIHEE